MDPTMHLRPHAVAFPFPSQGHINPMIQLCRALAGQGFIITFVHTEGNFARFRADNDESEDVFRHETIPDNLPIPISQLNIFLSGHLLKFIQALQEMEPQLEELLRTKVCQQGPPVSCLISDVFVDWSQKLARRIGIPLVTFWTSTASFGLLEQHLPMLLENGAVPVQDPSSEELIDYVPGLPPIPLWSLPSTYRAKEEFHDPGFKRKIARAQRLKEADFVFINTAEELEPTALEALKVVNPNTLAVGPTGFLESNLKQPSSSKEGQKCLQWLDEHKPASVLYIAFGSVAALTVQQVQELATGLEKLGHPYLWALRPDAVEMKKEEFEELRNGVRASKGLLIDWSPQQEVLKHPATGGFLTHCGWNSTLESLSAGVPMLCFPCVAEQHVNCRMIVDEWEIGVRFSVKSITTGLVGSDEFVQVAGRLMGELGPQLRANATQLRKLLHKAVAAEGSSRSNLRKLSGLLRRSTNMTI